MWLQGTGMGYDLLSAGRLPEYEAFYVGRRRPDGTVIQELCPFSAVAETGVAIGGRTSLDTGRRETVMERVRGMSRTVRRAR